MGFEVEIKFRVADLDPVARRLAELGAEAGERIDLEDGYLAHPGRDFAQTDEALRIRREGDANHLTYKGPKRGGPTKTREEIEVPFATGPSAGEQMGRLLERLGFRPVAVVRKARTPYRLDYQGRRLEVVLDRVDGLGSFAEVEALALGEADLPEAQGAVLGLAAALGLTEVEPRSYLRMVLEQAGRRNSAGPT
jgi:adenylate cyclase class 2